jgi:hypothetical protein
MPLPIFVSLPFVSMRDSASWERANLLLGRTLRSILNQTHQEFEVFLCSHDRPEIPEMDDPRIRFVHARFRRAKHPAEFLDDKINKRKTTLLEIRKRGEGYVIHQDADDLLSNRLFDHIARTQEPHGYIYTQGYLMDFETGYIAPVPGMWNRSFDQVCGSCAAIRLGRDDIEAEAGPLKRLLRMAGLANRPPVYANKFRKHGEWTETARNAGRPLTPVPFPAAMYTINTSINTSSFLKRSEGKMEPIARAIAKHRVLVTPEFAEEFAMGEFPLAMPAGFGPVKPR